MIIGTRCNQILPDTSAGMQHGPVIVRRSNVAGIGGTPHQFGTTEQGIAPSR